MTCRPCSPTRRTCAAWRATSRTRWCCPLQASDPPVFALDGLSVAFGRPPHLVTAVRGVSLAVRRNEALGVVGESGSGKSVSLLAPFGLLPPAARIVGGTAWLEGEDLLSLGPGRLRSLLGRRVGFVFQNPVSSLDPVLTIGAQLTEAVQAHGRASGAAARDRAAELLVRVGITDPAARMRQYPHEFSGGMCQRVMIATALANRPALLVADEPTTAVDATVQAQILALLRELRSEIDGGVVLVSHDLGVIAQNTERLAVLYAGTVVETGRTGDLLAAPQHPYTQGLLSCRPSLRRPRRLVPIPGQPATAGEAPDGCAFAPRCPIGQGITLCRTAVPPLADTPHGQAACHFAGQVAFRAPELPIRPRPVAGPPVMRVSGLAVTYGRKALFRRRPPTPAVQAISLDLHEGEALGIVGESGSGKTTLGRAMGRLLDVTGGQVQYAGHDVTGLRGRALRRFRDKVQLVFQDPVGSMNPCLGAGANAAEPLRIRGVPAAERRRRVLDRFAEVGLLPEHYDRDVAALSGGQLQRVGLARALVLDPEVLILDEPVSALDASVQAGILNLLLDLRGRRTLSYVFISHDMSVVRYLCDRVAVVHRGRLVELGTVQEVFDAPRAAYTRQLLSAVPATSDEGGSP